ncbi:MAG: recombinase family protein [Candidatus Kerfeldbacteria bacterium]|nr:recombinase family protein [Candidatus Kerfeldbacteria bacterium]
MGLLIDERQKAVAYYRHSREQAQENSIPIQRERVRRWAEEHNVEIVHEEEDAGESGLTADRPGFQNLIKDWILDPAKVFKWVLFLDVSRMGRFQNPNEAGHLEYEWGLRGRRVWYIDRGQLPKQPDAIDYMLTMMQRLGAAEHSAKLSDRVWHGCVRISKDGFSAGGSPCYGMERILLNEQQKFVCVLKPGEHKQISNQRVKFRPRDDGTSAAVRTIFHLFVEQELRPNRIAQLLKQRRIPSPSGGHWQSGAIMRILRNETYIGTRIYNKSWKRLKQRRRANPRSEWVICLSAFPATVSPAVFFAAQKRLQLMLPAQKYKGRRLIRVVERQLVTEIAELIHASTVAEQLDAWPTATFPLVFSIRQDRPTVGYWHFTIPESLRIYDQIIGVGLVFDRQDTIETFFAIPTSDFGPYNVLVFSENARESPYRITKQQAKDRIIAVLRPQL